MAVSVDESRGNDKTTISALLRMGEEGEINFSDDSLTMEDVIERENGSSREIR